MRNVLALFVALVFVLYSSMLAAAPAHACCKSADCPVTQCVAADCLPSAMPAALGDIAPQATPPASVAAQCPAPAILPTPPTEVWCPPD